MSFEMYGSCNDGCKHLKQGENLTFLVWWCLAALPVTASPQEHWTAAPLYSPTQLPETEQKKLVFE